MGIGYILVLTLLCLSLFCLLLFTTSEGRNDQIFSSKARDVEVVFKNMERDVRDRCCSWDMVATSLSNWLLSLMEHSHQDFKSGQALERGLILLRGQLLVLVCSSPVQERFFLSSVLLGAYPFWTLYDFLGLFCYKILTYHPKKNSALMS